MVIARDNYRNSLTLARGAAVYLGSLIHAGTTAGDEHETARPSSYEPNCGAAEMLRSACEQDQTPLKKRIRSLTLEQRRSFPRCSPRHLRTDTRSLLRA